jgi:hypothetical protein
VYQAAPEREFAEQAIRYLLVLFSICVNLSHLRIPSEKLASFVTLFTIEEKLVLSSAHPEINPTKIRNPNNKYEFSN